MKKTAIVLCVALLAGPSCGTFGDDELGPMTLRVERGGVEIIRPSEEEPIRVGDEARIEPLDVIRTEYDGVAELQLEEGRRFELAEDTRALVLDGSTIEGQQGSLLAQAEAPLSVTFGDVTATADEAIFRVDRGAASVRAAAYEGTLEVGVPGEPRMALTPLFEAEVAGAVDLPSGETPYGLNPRDPWDKEFLERVVELQKQLAELGSDLSRFIGEARPDLDFFSNLVGGQSVAFVRAELNRRRPADLLTGFLIALNTPKGSLRAHFRQAFRLFDAGGVWAVVAAIMGARIRPLLAHLTDIVTETVAVAQVTSDEELIFAGDESPPTVPEDPSPPPPPPPSPSESPTKKPPKSPTPPPGCSNSVECAVEDIIPDESPSPSPVAPGPGSDTAREQRPVGVWR